ncbi:MAG: BCSC C-terminal domain-containing protein [Deltaproteobacteria bacterium]|nr:BCSC C-terminal domain-containing protein [Deltaproteobacteria bacterium]
MTILVLALVAASAVVTPGHAAEPTDHPEAIEQLLENVRYWQARGRPDKAAEAWRKVLRSDPKHAEALAELALVEARAGREAQARELVERLKRAHPSHPRLAALEQALGLGAKYDDYLGEARAAVKAGKIAEALDLYRKVFGAQPPAGSIGLEYYQTLGGTSGGWDDARAGLERLARENPGDARYAVAHARHLTYSEITRREGIRLLEGLAGGAEGARARAAWRQALLWLAVQPPDFPMFERYLAQNPSDGDVRARITEAKSGVAAKQAADVERERLAAGYDALGESQLDEAEALFRRAVKANPRDADALAGLGNAVLRKEGFDEAKALFEKVKALAPKRPELWQEPLRSAEFWSLVRGAEKLRVEKKLVEAEASLKEAMVKSPKDAMHAELALANVMLDAERWEDAQTLFEAIATKDPKHVGALQGLVELYLRADDEEKALAANQRLAALDPKVARRDTWIRSEVMRREAEVKRKQLDYLGAEGILDSARSIDPENRNVLLDQAYNWLALSKATEARGAVEALQRLGHDTDSKVAAAWVYSAESRFQDAIDVLRGVPEAELDEDTRRLGKRLRIQADIAQTVKMATRGKMLSAQARLTELQRQTREQPELTGLVANAWADIGKYDQALAVMYSVIDEGGKVSPTLKLQLAGILHKADREADLLDVLRELEVEPDLTASEKQGLADLKIAYAIKRADVAREGGYLTRAFNLLQGPLESYPNDPRLMTALGRLFVTAGEYAEADEIFARVLTTRPEDLEAREGAIRSAIEVGKEEKARRLMQQGIELMDAEPRMHLVAGRMHVMLGDDGAGMEAFERALALEEGRSSPEAEVETGVSKLLGAAAARFGKGERKSSGDDITLRREIVREIENLRARHAVRLGTEVNLRFRNGLAGLGEVLAVTFPTWLSIPTGYRGRLTFSVVPIIMNAGELDLEDELVGSRFGTTGVDLHGTAAGLFPQEADAIELKLRHEIGRVRFEVGSTPLGFLNQTLVGGIRWSDTFGGFGIGLEGWRRAVTDSLLSWSGVNDVATGAEWGGVLRHGGRLELGISVDDVTWFLWGGADWWHGTRVLDNISIDAGTGLTWRLYDWDETKLATGFTVTTSFFEHNLRHFTLGHGGYFSPQAFVGVGVPLKFAGREGDVTFDLEASLGVNWFKEDDVAYYPTDPARQAARAQLLDADDEPAEAIHPGQDSFAFGLNARGELAYEAARGFKIGLRAEIHTGHDYQEYIGAVWAGYTFERRVDSQGDDAEGERRR